MGCRRNYYVHAILAVVLVAGFSAITRAEAPDDQLHDTLAECAKKTDSGSAPALMQCLETLQRRARDELAKTLTGLHLRIQDHSPGMRAAQLATLNQSEFIFMRFREIECRRIWTLAMADSNAFMIEKACRIDLLRWRNAQLQK
jgi:uncharacterized protein YecT (DUF1311 family)